MKSLEKKNVLTSHLDFLGTINKEIGDCLVDKLLCSFACTVDFLK